MPEPLSSEQILAEEYKVLRPDVVPGPAVDHGRFPQIHQQDPPLSALCLSGGGIRSATFALGIIQGLAERGLLGSFDYLSTVSGGGYIGGWLTAWKQRVRGLQNVVPLLGRNASSLASGCADPIQQLREYNNYLSPKAGLLSADTWTIVATVVRNMLLNWLVFVPLLLAALMAPRLLLSLGRLGDTFFAVYGDGTAVNPALLSKVLPVLTGMLFAFAILNILRYLPGVGGRNHTEGDYIRFCLLPLIGAAVAFVTNDSWFAGGDLTRTGSESTTEIGYWALTGRTVAAASSGWILYLIVCGKSARERLRLFFPVSAAVVLTSFSAGSGAWLLIDVVYPAASWPVYSTVAVPLLLLALALAGCLFVGFTSRVLRDEDREWLSRAGAWLLMFVMCWTVVCTLVLILPVWAFTLPKWGESALGSMGVAAGWISAIIGSSSKSKSPKEARTGEPPPASAKLMSVAMKLAAPVFVCAFLVSLSMLTNWILAITRLGAHSRWNMERQAEDFTFCPNCAWWDHRAMLEGTRWESVLILGLAFLAFGWVMARFININRFSLQGMYRDRLIRAYLGASNTSRKARDFTGFVQSDNLQMHCLDPALKPFHVVNVTLNLVSGTRLAWQQRKAESFTVSPLHSGSPNLGYRPSSHYGGPDGISLGTAVSISGAAASPNMGYNSSAVIGFIMTLFNARLGGWLGNPGSAGSKTWRHDGPTSAIASIVREAFGLTNDTSKYVYLSDGGHFENLGIYEMVRRRCRYIVVSDAGCDADFNFEDLGNALRKIRIDMKIPIDFEDGAFEAVREKKQRFALARIRYSLIDNAGQDGFLLYIKPMMRGNEPPDVTSYQSNHLDFPHQSTADQFFDESQTESYRMLGLHTIDEMIRDWDQSGGIPGLIQHASAVYAGDLKSQAAVASGTQL